MVHIDFMIGSPDLDIDGLTQDGSLEPVVRSAEWAFDVGRGEWYEAAT